jgi:ABC 3 transport family
LASLFRRPYSVETSFPALDLLPDAGDEGGLAFKLGGEGLDGAEGCIGFLMTERFGRMLAIATASAAFSCMSGVYVSYFINGSTAACIVLIQTTIFVLALCFAPKRGLFRSRPRLAESVASSGG